MLRLLLAAALLPALAGCQHAPEPTAPLRPCYKGVVVGSTCMDGLFVDVDAATPIGRPVTGLGHNVIGALNVRAIGSLGRVGQRLYFTCSGDTAGYAESACPANTIPANVPHVLLRAFSATDCPAGSW